MSLQNTSSVASPSIVNVASSANSEAQSEAVIGPDSQLPTEKEKESDSQLQRVSGPWAHIQGTRVQPVYKCLACTHETATFYESMLHEPQCVTGVSHHRYRERYACIICREEYSAQQTLVIHYVKRHAAVQCTKCNFYFVSLRGNATYLVSDHRNFRYQCQFCYAWKLTITEIKRHCVEKHETRSCFYQLRTFYCQNCEASSPPPLCIITWK